LTVAIKDTKLEMIRGDDNTYRITVKDEDEEKVDLTGSKIWFTVKKKYTDDDDDAEISLTTDVATELLILDQVANKGQVMVYVKNVHTQDLSKGYHVYDMQVKTSGAAIKTVLKGPLEVKRDVTRSIT
jgi:hypothetical protein